MKSHHMKQRQVCMESRIDYTVMELLGHVCVCAIERVVFVCGEELGCCILVAFKVSVKWGQLHSAREELDFLRKYTQAIETNTDAHRILSTEALLSCNPNSLSSSPSMTILCIT